MAYEGLSRFAAQRGRHGNNDWWPVDEEQPTQGMSRMTSLSKTTVASVGIEIVRYDTILMTSDNTPESITSEFGVFLDDTYLVHEDAARFAEAFGVAARVAGDME